uniref:Transposase n=1 Tax=Heterorhabditis bacteriophora TaxID=37862 RepID=A0A1I7XKK6_HETBA
MIHQKNHSLANFVAELKRRDLLYDSYPSNIYDSYAKDLRCDYKRVSTFSNRQLRQQVGKINWRWRLFMVVKGWKMQCVVQEHFLMVLFFKITDPTVRVDFSMVTLPEASDLTVICWGKRNFHLVRWV